MYVNSTTIHRVTQPETLESTLISLSLCTFLPSNTKDREYTFFSATLGTFTNLDYILGHKVSLNKYQILIIIIWITIFHHNIIKWHISSKGRQLLCTVFPLLFPLWKETTIPRLPWASASRQSLPMGDTDSTDLRLGGRGEKASCFLLPANSLFWLPASVRPSLALIHFRWLQV